ncbi:hypothetical protein [Humibacter sp. RRB41]|uniref:DUF7882 family protein n=1 Tax=Humibacter sp. RRB41 TaxID=2919946 RepID=UPI001FA9D5E6|nr:hypothetical protein [Humibacter sp. RRB41]
MGDLIYAGSARYRFDDRALAHLKIAITQKLRLQECFLLSWTDPASTGSGRVSLWLSSAIPLEFRYATDKPPALNRNWLAALAMSAHGTRGMIVMTEEEAEQIIAASTPAEKHERMQETADRTVPSTTPRQQKRRS